MACKFALTETRDPPAGTLPGLTFVYTLTVDYDASAICGSPELHPKASLCPDPPQPKPHGMGETEAVTLQI